MINFVNGLCAEVHINFPGKMKFCQEHRVSWNIITDSGCTVRDINFISHVNQGEKPSKRVVSQMVILIY